MFMCVCVHVHVCISIQTVANYQNMPFNHIKLIGCSFGDTESVVRTQCTSVTCSHCLQSVKLAVQLQAVILETWLFCGVIILRWEPEDK